MVVLKKYKEQIFYVCLVMISLCFFLLLGEQGYYEYSDSFQYIQMKGAQGVVPLYPLFIHAHRLLLGEGGYLYGVVISQTLIAIICIIGWNIWIRKKFAAGYITLVLVYLVSLIPFTVDMPITLINHSIITEALAYPLFYVFVILFVESIFRRKICWNLYVFAASIVMALIRTQMQICLGFTALSFVYMMWGKIRRQEKRGKIVRYVFSIMGGVVVALLGELVILQTNQHLMEVQGKLRENYYFVNEEYNKNQLEEKERDEGKTEKYVVSNVMGQFDSILIDKTFYEIEEDDRTLFKNREIQELVSHIYNVSENERANYKYAKKGLWKWQDIMNGTAAGTSVVQGGWESFLNENPHSVLQEEQRDVNRQISFVLLKAHCLRIVYHMLCMLPQGFICTVFFQIEEIYGLCHIYTFLIYFVAIGMVFFGIKRKQLARKRYELMACVMTLNIGMVVVICTVFVGMQRYLIYGFGIFYTGFLLLVEDMWRIYGEKLWKKGRKYF